jgi:hypothetical protein
MRSLIFNNLFKLKLMSNYKEMDQTHWVCYELPGKAYYYGEVSLLDESGVVQSKDSPEAANPKNKLVKHGFGIYLYSLNAEGQHSRYEVPASLTLGVLGSRQKAWAGKTHSSRGVHLRGGVQRWKLP